MNIKLILIICSILFWTFGQKKKECSEKLDIWKNRLSGQWKLVTSELILLNNKHEYRKCPDHFLTIDNNSKFSVRHRQDSFPYQTGSIKIKTENPKNYDNCDMLIYFKSKDEQPLYAWDFDTYHAFWIVEKCTTDTLEIHSPTTSDLIDKKSGNVCRQYVRQK